MILTKFPQSKLAELLSSNSDTKFVDNNIFIDRNPKMFEYVLDYLRTGQKQFIFQDKPLKILFDLELDYWKLENKQKTTE